MYLYLAKNKLSPGFCKIGYSKHPHKRMKELYGPWKVVKKWKTPKAAEVELRVRHILRPFVVSGHELFNCPIKHAIAAVRQVLEEPLPVVEIPGGAFEIQDSKELGSLVRAIRKSMRITQEDAAGSAGTGPRFLGDLEGGKQSCHIGKAIHTMRMLGVKIYIEYNLAEREDVVKILKKMASRKAKKSKSAER